MDDVVISGPWNPAVTLDSFARVPGAGRGVVVNVSHPLVVILVHGIGPQNAPEQYAFLDRLEKATVERLAQLGQAQRASRLVMERADWSALFPQRQAWLMTLFPSHASRWTRLKRALGMLLPALIVPVVIVAVGTASGMHSLRPPVLGWFVGTFVGLVVAALAGWFIILPNFPWGHLWTFGRRFEADSVSDIILYGSDGPRQQILDVVLNKLQKHLPEKYSLAKGMQECLPVIFIGHSLGTVVVYDLLLGIGARMRNEETAVQRQLMTVTRELQTSAGAPIAPGPNVETGGKEVEARRSALQQRKVFLQRAKQIEDNVCPLGMITMGSPIALFVFRKPSLLDRKNLWEEACPAAFQPSGFLGTLRWRWQNFWHPSDFVAHRLEALFNEGYPTRRSPAAPRLKFVEDVKTRAWARGPISAHSTYWTNPAILKRISEHVADVLVALP